MKFHFEDQTHQTAAIDAVVSLFEGALIPPLGASFGQASGAEGHAHYKLERSILADKLTEVTGSEESGVDRQTNLELLRVGEDLQGEPREFPNFSVEMETGTGKTFVYIATALKLAQDHGLRKFVILTHSVAIRAGVTKTLEQTEEYFRKKFPSLNYRWGILGESHALDDFLEPSNSVQFLVASVQAIDKPDSGVVYQEAEQPQLWGESGSGMASISRTYPVVIIDEPQNFKTELRRKAVATLNPLLALRYSATHTEKFNLVHRLGPKAATELGLVKRVLVKGVSAGLSGKPYLRVDKLRSKNKRLFAEIMMDVDSRSGPKRTNLKLQSGQDLYELSGKLEQYKGMVVDRLERKPDCIIFENGSSISVGEEIGVDRIAIWQDQIRHTIRAHLDRQKKVEQAGYDVKVLSLFFVDRVADYCSADGRKQATLPALFDKIYKEEWQHSGRAIEDCPDPSTLRTHYFPSTKTGIYKDANGNSQTAQELQSRAYEEIVANKEKILTKDNPRSFIFSHSALREGWDNPNVFQIGFLRHSGSEVERRQQVGRGLRLPVNQEGKRLQDKEVFKLTLVVDETFSEFRDGLNKEYLASGSGDAPEPSDADSVVTVRRRPEKFLSSEFQELWKRIRFKARYRVKVDSNALPLAVASSEHLDELNFLSTRANRVQTAELEYDTSGKVITSDESVGESAGTYVSIVGQRLPDVVRLVEDQLLSTKFPLQLSRSTILNIIECIPDHLKSTVINDPDRWARIVSRAIRAVTVEEMINRVIYEPDPNEEWWDAEMIFVEEEEVAKGQAYQGQPPSNSVIKAPEEGVNLFDHVIYDSLVEKDFASMLENSSEQVKLFTKLPRRFKIRTPVGEYSPDWAIVFEENGFERVYLIRETKGTTNLDDLKWDEAMRIRFAERHFSISPCGTIDYDIASNNSGLRLKNRTQKN